MTTSVHPLGNTFAGYQPPRRVSGPIVVASDISSHSDAAFPLAQSLAQHANTTVHVISALRPLGMPMHAFDAMPMVVETDAAARAARRAMVEGQRNRIVSPTATWPVEVRTGEPATEIVDFAKSIDAQVIVVGRGRHAALQRALGGETVLRLLQLGDIPVLAAETRLAEPPKRVVIATDFSEFSLYAALVAMPLLAVDAHVMLVHVAPPLAETDVMLTDRAVAYRNQALHRFSQLQDELARDQVTFETVYAVGNPSDELLKIVRTRDADLVVSATHGYGFLRRMVLGSVAAELVRHAPCSVLCVPGSASTLFAARARPSTSSTTRSLDLTVLDAELNALSLRNAGRTCTVEIDRRDMGAQILGHALPLVGVTYDRTSHLVALMFGASTLAGEHLTHVVPDVVGIEVVADTNGRDLAMRLAHRGGQTLVLLE